MINLKKVPKKNLAPYISRIGVVHVDPKFVKHLMKKNQDRIAIENAIDEKIRQGDPQFITWVQVQKPWTKPISSGEFYQITRGRWQYW